MYIIQVHCQNHPVTLEMIVYCNTSDYSIRTIYVL